MTLKTNLLDVNKKNISVFCGIIAFREDQFSWIVGFLCICGDQISWIHVNGLSMNTTNIEPPGILMIP